jgi:ribose transport system substrate-binding protein
MAVVAVLLPACKPGGGTSGDPSKPLVAFISNNEHEFWTIAQRGAEAAGAEFNVRVEFKKPSGGGSSEQQRRFIEDLRAKGCRAIAISPNDSANQAGYFKEVNSQLPLLAVDNDIPDVAARRCYLGTDNVAAGRAVGKILKQAMPNGGTFMIFVGRLDSQNAVERRKGVVIELAGGEDNCKGEIAQMDSGKYPVTFGKYQLLDTRTDGGQDEICRAKADDALTKGTPPDCMVGLWAYNPPKMLEAYKAAKDKIKKSVVLIGFDENKETLQGIKDDFIAATVVQDPYLFGYESVKIMAQMVDPAKTGTALTRKDINAQQQIFVPHRIINKDGKHQPMYQDEKVEAVDPFWDTLRKRTGG